jgi:phosphoglycolate phosphatase-like HAD superfamily hydrolase
VSDDLHPEVADQIAGLDIDTSRPLVVSDADDVIFNFVLPFTEFLPQVGLEFTWKSYRFTGNILREDGTVAENDEAWDAFHAFYDRHGDALEPIPGAVEALLALSARATVIVLTNLPGRHRKYRATNLARLGLNFPLVINIGRKGPAMRALAEGVGAPVFFLDDSPRHIESVAETAPDVVRLHFVGDKRLATIVEPAPRSHHRTDDWRSARAIIESRLADDGF